MHDELKIRSFTDLNAWKEGHKLVLVVYEISKNFPKEEMFGLTSQMRRCAVSITSNIAAQSVKASKLINGLIKYLKNTNKNT